jgi:RNA ligase (TIGR02306 family)
MSRTLASVQQITALSPIEGADAIEVADVLGWKVVVKKGEFQVGDLAVYLEIDSVPPDEEQYRFLWKSAEQRPNNFRIKTIKLRGQISQGILFPMDLETLAYAMLCQPIDQMDTESLVGTDLTDFLRVEKYEAPLPRGSADIAGQFFDGVPKTDEERVQSSTGRQHLAALQGRPYYITVKCDGASMTVASHDAVPKVASRNYRLADNPDSAYWNAARSGGLLRFVELFPHMAVQGELCGPGIQGNRLGLSEHRCFVFNVYNRDLDLYMPWDTIADIAQEFFFDTVPLLEFGLSFNYDAADLLYLAEGKYEGTNSEREGIVIRNDDDGPFTSFKAISNRYLLKGGE